MDDRAAEGLVQATVGHSGTLQGIGAARSVYIENFNIYNAATPGASRQPQDSYADIVPCPYPGLTFFGPQDAARFFGRESAIQQLQKRVERQVLTALVGASGSGKSSVVLAGLAPYLDRQEGWRFSYFRIGTELDKNPLRALSRALVPLLNTSGSTVVQLLEIQELASALECGSITLGNVLSECVARNSGRKVLIIADQFEEAFTAVSEDDRDLRNRFIDILLSGFRQSSPREIPTTRLILTLRADFYGMALRHRALADALQDNIENLGPMTREELRQAIVKPASDVQFDPGLLSTLLDDVIKRPGSLPLLQFALREMWGLQKGGRLSRENYEAIGGVEGALARRAQAVYDQLTEKGQRSAEARTFRLLFTRLVHLGEGAEDTRRVVDRDELGPAAWELAQLLAGEANRLIVTTAGTANHETAEVAHEALIRGWPTLVEWTNRDRAFQSWLRQVKGRVHEWRSTPGDEGTLLRGGPLSTAEDWLARRTEDLNDDERHYIEASVRHREAIQSREKRLREEELRRERTSAELARQAADQEARLRAEAERGRDLAQQARRRTRIALGLAVVLLVAVAVGAFLLRRATTAAVEERELALFATKSMAQISGAASEEALRLSEEAEKAAESGSTNDRIQTYLDFAKHFDLDWHPGPGKDAIKNLESLVSSVSAGSAFSEPTANQRLLNRFLVYAHEIDGDLEFTNDSESAKAPNEYAQALALFDRSDAQPAGRARIWGKVAKLRLYRGDGEGASAALNQADSILAAVRDFTTDRALVDDVWAQFLIKKGDVQQATTRVEEALAIWRNSFESQPEELRVVINLAGELERLGDLQRHSGDGRALTSYREALSLFERAAREDPTSFEALGGIDTVHHSLRYLGKAAEVDGEATAAAARIAERVDQAFSEGIGPYKFGMTIDTINAMIPLPPEDAGRMLPSEGGEFRWAAGVTYVWRWLREVPDFAVITQDDACTLNERSYVSFVFHDSGLFRVDVRLPKRGTQTCPAIAKMIDGFATRYGLSASGASEERRLRFETMKVAVNAVTERDILSLDFIQR